MALKVKLLIDNVDRTANLLERQWQIQDNAFGGIDRASFVLHDPTKAITLTRGKDVVIENFNDANDRKFGGLLTEVVGSTDGIGRLWTCKALGWSFILERALVTQTYYGKSDQYIIKEAVSSPKGIFASSDTSFNDFDYSTNVDQGIANTQFIQFKRQSLRDAMDVLADMSGFVWHVDPFKKVFYKALGYSSHTFQLHDAPDDVTKFAYFDLKQFYDFTKIVNSVTVEGGFKRFLNQTVNYRNDGVEKKFSKLERWQAKQSQTRIQVFKNTGTDGSPTWTAQTVGLAGVDSLSTKDCLWDPVARVLEFNTAPPNFATNSFQIQGDILRQMIHTEPDQSSIDKYGRRYSLALKDPSIVSDEHVILVAQAELAKRASEVEKLTLRTNKDGIEAGKLIRVVNTVLGIDADYLVRRVNTQLLGGQVAEYQLELEATT